MISFVDLVFKEGGVPLQVFPGGNCDPKDGGRAMTAIRETFEESGLLLASHDLKHPSQKLRLLDDLALDKARNAVLKQETTFNEFLSDNNLTADVDELLPFTQWVTPPTVAPRSEFFFRLPQLPRKIYPDSSLDVSTSTSS
jgi:8-oxo-dGTP pyrophosphatase MutT (NUDIX family)